LLYELDESAPDKCSGYHEARAAGQFPGAELAVRSLLDDSLRSFQIRCGNSEPKRSPFFTYALRAPLRKKKGGPKSALDLAALFHPSLSCSAPLLQRSPSVRSGDGISNVRDGPARTGAVGPCWHEALLGPGGSRDPRARAVREASHIGQDRDGWRCCGIRRSQRLVRRARLWKFRFRSGFGQHELARAKLFPGRSRLLVVTLGGSCTRTALSRNRCTTGFNAFP
jgi:hypothetical protein